MDKQWRPLRNVLLVKPISSERRVGSIFVPDSSPTPARGIVYKIGPFVRRSDFSIGEEVIFPEEAGFSVYLPDESEKLMAVAAENILAVKKNVDVKKSVI